jgi:hypothetical protein
MKLWSVIGLLFTAAILATIPISPQVTQRGVELTVNQAQAITYGRYRRVTRRAYRRAGYAAAAGYTATAAGYGYGGVGYGYGGAGYAGYGGPGYGYGGPGNAYAAAGYGPGAAGYGYGAGGYGYRVEPAGPGRSCAVYPSGFRWCWTQL